MSFRAALQTVEYLVNAALVNNLWTSKYLQNAILLERKKFAFAKFESWALKKHHLAHWNNCTPRQHEASVTRSQNVYSIFGHLQQYKLAQKHTEASKVGSKFCEILIKPSKDCQIFLTFCQSGEISPNLVTLHGALQLMR